MKLSPDLETANPSSVVSDSASFLPQHMKNARIEKTSGSPIPKLTPRITGSVDGLDDDEEEEEAFGGD